MLIVPLFPYTNEADSPESAHQIGFHNLYRGWLNDDTNTIIVYHPLMLPIDLTAVLKDAPVGDWIALSHQQDRIVATAKSLDEAIKAAKEQGEEAPIVLKVPPVSALVL